MRKNVSRIFLCITVSVLGFTNMVTGTPSRDEAPRVFLDGRHIDTNYIRSNITFVNYVRDREEADIHVLFTTQSTASGGIEYTLTFMGRNTWIDQNNTLTYCSLPTDTRDERRSGLTQILKLGLAPYIASTPLAQSLSLNFDEKAGPSLQKPRQTLTDPWNNWVFRLSFNTRIRGESSKTSKAFSGSVNADRITDTYKFRFNLNHWEESTKYDYEDYNHTDRSHRAEMTTLFAKSLNDHWSLGGWLSFYRSSFQNMDMEINPMPAVEYNVFPYSQSTRRQLRILYRIGYAYTNYNEPTIFDKTEEHLAAEALRLSFEINEPWGYGRFSLEGRHYFHDLEKRRLTFDGRVSFRLAKGLSFDVRGRYSATQDQLALAKDDASLEELLLQRKELASDYRYDISFGVGYRFGSIFSNIVNPRFGGSNRTPSH